ncbi:hypothetical protein [Sphingobacterium yanglingense]|nr:hypothetical protein [Sphingobacterium yanglingense]
MILILLSEMIAELKTKIAKYMPLNDMRLRESVIGVIKSDNNIKTKLALSLNKSYPTIQRYINNNDVMLTTASAMEVLRSELQLTNEELLNN